MNRTLAAALIACTLSIPTLGQQTPPVFRSSVDLVSVPALVRQKNRPVSGLTQADFQLLDNGVPQQLTSTAIEMLPLDVTLVLDASSSVQGRLAQFKSEIQEIAEALQTNDRVRLIAFSTTVREVLPFQPGGSRIPLDSLTAGGGTALYDALAGALMSLPDSPRPQLVFGFSDGVDVTSFLDADRVVALAGRTSALLYIRLVSTPGSKRGDPLDVPALGVFAPGDSNVRAAAGSVQLKPDWRRIQEAAERTGGALVDDSAGAGLSRVFARALEEFRTSYMLRYAPQGVPPSGWHDIVVRVTRPGKFDVRARRGYEAG